MKLCEECSADARYCGHSAEASLATIRAHADDEFPITLVVKRSVIDDAIWGAHCRYWCSDLSWDGESGFAEEREGGTFAKHGPRHALSAESIRHGLSELARVSPYIFGKLLANDLDGPMADVLLQLCAGVVRTDKGHDGEPKYG